jgi:HAE1 family hydrophobic/amphiphilic exporter-1
VGAEYVVIEDLNQGVRKPVQIQFSGPDYRRLMAITSDFMEKMKGIKGAVDVGLSEQEPKDELKIELDRASPTTSASRWATRRRRCAWPLPAWKWATGSIPRRDARRRGAPASRRPRRCLQHRAPADRGSGSNMMVPLDQIADRSPWQGPGADPALDGKRTVAVLATRRTAARARSPRTR